MDTPPPSFYTTSEQYFKALNNIIDAIEIRSSSVVFLYVVPGNSKIATQDLQYFKLLKEKFKKFPIYLALSNFSEHYFHTLKC